MKEQFSLFRSLPGDHRRVTDLFTFPDSPLLLKKKATEPGNKCYIFRCFFSTGGGAAAISLRISVSLFLSPHLSYVYVWGVSF